MKLNNKGMSVVEVVLTFALIMMITSGLLMIVVHYRNKVSVSSERLNMDTFKNNITQDIYNDALTNGISEMDEFSYVDVSLHHDDFVFSALEKYEETYGSTNGMPTFFSNIGVLNDDANIKISNLFVDILENHELKDYADGTDTGVLLNMIRNELVNRYGECITLTELNRCVNIKFQKDGVNDKVFGTSIVDTESKESIENKFLYYDGIKYKINDKLPNTIPKDANGNERKLVDLQRVKINDDGLLGNSVSVLEDGTIVTIYTLDVLVYHVDFREDFGVHIVLSTDDVSI